MSEQAYGPYKVGKCYLFRTVTNYFTGRVTDVYTHEIVLETAAWVADTGRYSEAIATGKLVEVEVIVGECILNRASIVDAVEWTHPLPVENI